MDATEPAPVPWAAALYDECAAELILYGRALGLSHAESEDALHDVFRILLQLTTPPRHPRFYALRSFRNRCHNHRRSLWRRLTREWEAATWFDPHPTDPIAEDVATAALAQLPPDQREVIVLKIWHQLTFEAIGELLALSPHTVAGRYRYGLQKLRHTLRSPSHESSPAPSPAWLPTSTALPQA